MCTVLAKFRPSDYIFALISTEKKNQNVLKVSYIQDENYKDFCPTKQTRIIAKNCLQSPKKLTNKRCYNPFLYGRSDILVIFGLQFGRNDDLIDSF